MSERTIEKSQLECACGEGTSETVASEGAASVAATPTLPVAPAAKPKFRHDWYQTESDICINILLKKVKRENVHVNFQEKMVGIRGCF